MRLVVDASVIADALWGDDRSRAAARDALGDAELAAPHLIDLEVAHVARCAVRQRRLTPDSALLGLRRLARLPGLDRIAHVALIERVWELRANVTAYDASYVALADALRAPLVTLDGRLARAAASVCDVVVVPSATGA